MKGIFLNRRPRETLDDPFIQNDFFVFNNLSATTHHHIHWCSVTVATTPHGLGCLVPRLAHFRAVRVTSPARAATSNYTVCMRAIHNTQPCGHTSTVQPARSYASLPRWSHMLHSKPQTQRTRGPPVELCACTAVFQVEDILRIRPRLSVSPNAWFVACAWSTWAGPSHHTT